MKVESQKLGSGELEVKLTFSAYDQLCLEHDLVDIVDWYSKGPASEKIHSCRKRMLKEHIDFLKNDPDFSSISVAEFNKIMQDEQKCVEYICKNPAYKNRKAREIK